MIARAGIIRTKQRRAVSTERPGQRDAMPCEFARRIRPLPMFIARTARACPGEGRGRASSDPSEGIPRSSPGRWRSLSSGRPEPAPAEACPGEGRGRGAEPGGRIWPLGRRHGQRLPTCFLLGPYAAQVL
jgi:hypothetical protein